MDLNIRYTLIPANTQTHTHTRLFWQARVNTRRMKCHLVQIAYYAHKNNKNRCYIRSGVCCIICLAQLMCFLSFSIRWLLTLSRLPSPPHPSLLASPLPDYIFSTYPARLISIHIIIFRSHLIFVL